MFFPSPPPPFPPREHAEDRHARGSMKVRANCPPQPNILEVVSLIWTGPHIETTPTHEADPKTCCKPAPNRETQFHRLKSVASQQAPVSLPQVGAEGLAERQRHGVPVATPRALRTAAEAGHGTENEFRGLEGPQNGRCSCGCGSKPMGSHFGVGAPPVLVYFQWGLGCSVGVRFGF